MTQEITPLIVHTGFLLRSTLTAKLKKKGYSITSDQWKALNVIHSKGEMTQVILGQNLYKAAPAISKIVSKLIAMDLLLFKQKKNDKREKLLMLSDQALALITDLNEVAAENHSIALEGLSDDEQLMLSELLTKIKSNLQVDES